MVKSEVPIPDSGPYRFLSTKHLYRGYATPLSYGGDGLGVVKSIEAQQDSRTAGQTEKDRGMELWKAPSHLACGSSLVGIQGSLSVAFLRISL